MKKIKAIYISIFLFLLPVLAFSENFYENQLNYGIKNSEAYSYLLIKKSLENKAASKDFFQKASEYSPDLPDIYFKLSWASLSFSVDGILDSIDYIIKGVNAYSRNFWWSFTLAGSLFLSLVLSFLSAIIIIIFIRLINDIPLIAHDISETIQKVYFMLVLLLASAVSPLFFLAGILVILGIYMKPIDRVVVYLFLVFLLLSPLMFKTASLFMKISSSGNIKSIVEVNESKGNTYALAALKNADEYHAMFSYALALKRQGFYDEAIAVYNRLLTGRQDPKAYVNLANCYVGLNNLEEAMKYYALSTNIKPLASAYYNLSQVSRELLDFKKGDEYFVTAVSLDRIAVSGYRAVYGRNPNRFVADETLNFSELWNSAMKKPVETNTFGMAVVPALVIPVLAMAFLAGFYFLNKRLRHKAYRCNRCSAILCTKCEKRIMWGHMCPQCYRSLIKLDEMDVKERVAKLLSIYAHQKKRRDIMKILSFVLPGTSFIYAGRIFLGLVFLWPFLFFILLPLTNFFFAINKFQTHSFFSWTAIFIATVVYLASNIITRQRISKGWL